MSHAGALKLRFLSHEFSASVHISPLQLGPVLTERARSWIFCSFATVLTIASRYLLAFCFFIPTSIIVACLACTELNKCGLITAGVFGLITAACHLFVASVLFNVYSDCEELIVQEETRTDDIFLGIFDATRLQRD